jgi:DNA-binding MarR family transcriptional regulator
VIEVSPSVRSVEEKTAATSLRVTIARIYRALRISATSTITPSQVSVLFRIEHSEPVRMGVLAHLERITPASLSKIVDSLEALELVDREPDPLDGRVTLLTVSSTGRELIRSQRTASTMALEEALAELTAADRDVLLQSLPALEKLSEILLGAREEI